MNGYLILIVLLCILLGIGSKFFGKQTSNFLSSESKRVGQAAFLVVNGSVSCVAFFCFSGFSINATPITILYSVGYAVAVAVSLVCTNVAYRMISISKLTIILSASGLIATVVFGILVFGEGVTFEKMMRLVLVMVAVILVFLDKQHSVEKVEPAGKRSRSIFFVLIIALLVAASSSSTLITKAYLADGRVTDEMSLFFFTNVFLVAGALIYICLEIAFVGKRAINDVKKLISVKKILILSSKALTDNLTTLATVPLISLLDVSIYSPISSSANILTGVAASFIFRERQNVLSYVAAIIAIVAVII